MLFLSFCLWCSALAFPSQNPPNMDGVMVYPIVYEDREDDQQKVIVIGNHHFLALKRASVLAPRVLLRNYKDDGTTEQYVNGAHYERHLYQNAANKTSLLVKPRKGGRYHVAGFINSTHIIEPVTDRMDLQSGIPHRISRIPSSTQSACRSMIKARSRTNASVPFPEARKRTAKHIIETFLISDWTHTEGLRQRNIDPMEYFLTFMHRVSLELQQLKPKIWITITGHQATDTKNVAYESRTQNGDLYDSETLKMLKLYASKQQFFQNCDLVILFTQSALVKEGAPPTLGIAYREGVCTEYREAVVKDAGIRNSGVYSATHEIGHTLGSYHDGAGTSVDCPAKDGYIMNPMDAGLHPDEFSRCSKDAIAKYLRHPDTSCLRYRAARKSSHLLPRPVRL
ncbi:hypothetical protein MTO96_039743 [Rhipicephalus appendiculatus]